MRLIVRDTNAFGDRADPDVAIKYLPAFFPGIGRWAAGEHGHAKATWGEAGESENLGRVLQKLKPANVAVGTKVRLPPGDPGRIAHAVTMSIEGSLALRLAPFVAVYGFRPGEIA